MKRLLVLCGMLCGMPAVFAQPTLDECRRLAQKHYPEIRRYDLIRRTAEYSVSNAKRAWLPQFSLSAQATWQTAVPGFPEQMTEFLARQGLDIPGLNKDQYKVQLELNQTLWDGGESRIDERLAEAEEKESQRSVDVDLYALEKRVDDLYFGILLLDKRIEQTRLTMDLLRSNLDKIRALQKNGEAMQSDADAVEAEWLSVGQRLAQEEASRDSYRRMLSIFIGRDLEGDKLLLPDVVEPLSSESTRPELALFEAQIDKYSVQEQRVKALTHPRFNLFAQGYYGYPGQDYFESMMSSDWSWNAAVGVRMSWNFGRYYTRRNSLNQLELAKRQIDVRRDVFLFNNRLEATEERGEIVRLREAIAADNRIVELRRSVREAAESKLRNGVIDMNDLLQKITEEDAALAARNAREIELVKAIYELKYTMNQ